LDFLVSDAMQQLILWDNSHVDCCGIFFFLSDHAEPYDQETEDRNIWQQTASYSGNRLHGILWHRKNLSNNISGTNGYCTQHLPLKVQPAGAKEAVSVLLLSWLYYFEFKH